MTYVVVALVVAALMLVAISVFYVGGMERATEPPIRAKDGKPYNSTAP